MSKQTTRKYRHEYRVVEGTSYEGLSIREMAYEDDVLVGWGGEPHMPSTGTIEELREEICLAIADFQDMLLATKKPVIKESDLEKRLEIGEEL